MIELVVLFAASIATVQGVCNKGCNVRVAHYEEIGCEAVFAKPDDCCPSHYNCAKFNAQEDNKCYFNGKVYKLHEHIDNNVTEIHCAASCYCHKGDWEDITCANIECPSLWYPGAIPLKPGCFYIDKIDGCCPEETRCPPFDKVAKCEVNGQTYYEGQEISVPGKERLLKCVCQPNFKGKLEEPFCRPITCGTELRDTRKIRQNYAPVYYGTELPCPIEWEYPQEGDHVKPNKDIKKSDHKCQYGNLTLNIGDQLVLNRPSYHPIMNCDCRIPPLVTCIQKPHEIPDKLIPVPIPAKL